MKKWVRSLLLRRKRLRLTFELLISDLKDTPAYRRLVGKEKCTFFYLRIGFLRARRQLRFYFIRPLHEKTGEEKPPVMKKKSSSLSGANLVFYFILYEDSVKTEKKKPAYLR